MVAAAKQMMISEGGGKLWSNSAEIFVRCTYPPSFIILCLLVRKLSCWQTHKQTGAAENIQRSSLCYDVG